MEGITDARFWLDLAQWLTTLGIGAYVWVATRQRATRDQIESVKSEAAERADRHAERLTKLEANMEHVPSRGAIDGLNQKLTQLHGDFQHMAGWLEGIKGLLSTLQGNVQQLVENELRGDRS